MMRCVFGVSGVLFFGEKVNVFVSGFGVRTNCPVWAVVDLTSM